jgi:hypothetical protein
MNLNNNVMAAKHDYDSMWISKRVVTLISNERICIDGVELKVKHCDPEYVDEIISEATEILESITELMLKNYLAANNMDPSEYVTFVDYACDIVKCYISKKMKLYNDECVSYLVIKPCK